MTDPTPAPEYATLEQLLDLARQINAQVVSRAYLHEVVEDITIQINAVVAHVRDAAADSERRALLTLEDVVTQINVVLEAGTTRSGDLVVQTPAPIVNVTIDAGAFAVTNDVHPAPVDLTLELPARQSTTTFDRDATGLVQKSTTLEVDAS